MDRRSGSSSASTKSSNRIAATRVESNKSQSPHRHTQNGSPNTNPSFRQMVFELVFGSQKSNNESKKPTDAVKAAVSPP